MSSSSDPLTIARQSYAAAIVGILTYGMYDVLVGICLHYLIKNWRRTTGHYITTAYVVLMLLVSIVYFACACKWSEIEFVEISTNPGAFATLTSGSRLTITKNVASTVNIFLADSLIIYRTYIVWAKRLPIVLVPIIMYLGTLATGIGLLYWSARPNAQFGQVNFVHFGIAFYSISVALNVVTTILIAGKLLYHQRQISKLRASTEYLGLVAICVESASIYSLSGIIYIPLFALNLPQQYPFAALLSSATVIAPTLIIMRIALGVAVKETYTTNSRHKFGSVMSGSTRVQESVWSGTKSETSIPSRVIQLHKMSIKDDPYVQGADPPETV